MHIYINLWNRDISVMENDMHLVAAILHHILSRFRPLILIKSILALAQVRLIQKVVPIWII